MNGSVRGTAAKGATAVRQWSLQRSVTGLAMVALVTTGTSVFASSPTLAQPAPRPAAFALGATVVSDAMNRTATGGWGKADVGGSYGYADPTAFSVDGSRGVIRLPAPGQSRAATLPVTAGDQITTMSLGVSALPTSGNGVSVGLVVRNSGGRAYRATVRLQPAGKASLAVVRIDGSPSALTPIGTEVVLPAAVAAGSMLTLQLSATGTAPVDIAAKAWPQGQPAPGWQITQQDSSAGRVSASGGNSVWAYASSSSQAASVLIDDYSVTVPGAAPPASSSVVPTPTPGPTPAPSASPTSNPSPSAPAPAPTPSSEPDQPTAFGGAAPLGATSYPYPADARFVAPSGSDTAPGTLAAPFRTVGRAIAVASSGQTIVLRAGTYHESVVIPTGKTLTLQPYPKEVVWFDGSSAVTAWSASGNSWRADQWTAEFDASPTYTRGAADNTQSGWSFVNPAYPMAAHPDQVWIDNMAQAQVGSLAEVGPGNFFVDYTGDALYLGSNPAGHQVRASDLSKAISVRSEGSVLRGLGVARYAPSVPDMGAVTIEKPKCTVENVVVTDSATTGLSVVATDATVTNVTSTRSGMLGMHANYADRLKITGLAAIANNVEHFNSAPVSGGLKITRTRDIFVSDSQFRDNLGPGLWLDESVYDVKIVNNKMIHNSTHGVSVELSAKATLIGNVIANNSGFGMKVNDTSQVRIWTNTLIDNGRPINIVQDARRASNQATPGHDPRQAFPDPTMTWLIGPVEVQNNIISGTTGNCLLCVEDYSKERTAEQMQVTAKGDVYRRPSTSVPQWVVVWSTGAGNPAVFTSVAAFNTATGQESVNLALDGTPATTADGAPTAPVLAAVATVAQPLPADLAALSGQGSGSKRLGSGLTY